MKTRIFYRLSAVVLFFALCLSSCTKEPTDDGPDGEGTENTDNGNGDGDGGNGDGNTGGDSGNTGGGGTTPGSTVKVKLNIAGEIAGLNNQPDNLLYVQIYNVKGNEEDGYVEEPYGHGLFDKLSDISVSLKKDLKYKFYATAVAGGVKRIASDDGLYGLPFNCKLTNSFETNTDFIIDDMRNGIADLAGSGIFLLPDIDRYYGESEFYEAISDNKTPADISLLRTTFGLKVHVENMTEGNLHIEVEGSPRVSVSYPDTEVSYIFSSGYPYDAYQVDAQGKTVFTNDYTESIGVNFIYESSDGLEVPVKREYCTFQRNTYTNLTVKIDGNPSESGFGITIEDTEMGNDGQDIEFVGGGDYKKM